jgi:hypothetical protein
LPVPAIPSTPAATTAALSMALRILIRPWISIRLDPGVREGIEAWAKADERSLSAYIYRVLRRHLEAEHATRPAQARAKAKP